MKYKLFYSNKFKKDLKRCERRRLSLSRLYEVVNTLQETGVLPPQYRPHKLTGDYAGCWECHIAPDWLLIWQQNDKELYLLMTGTGTHADLFN